MNQIIVDMLAKNEPLIPITIERRVRHLAECNLNAEINALLRPVYERFPGNTVNQYFPVDRPNIGDIVIDTATLKTPADLIAAVKTTLMAILLSNYQEAAVYDFVDQLMPMSPKPKE